MAKAKTSTKSSAKKAPEKAAPKKAAPKKAAPKKAAAPRAKKPAPWGATLPKPRGSKFRTIREASQFGTAADVKVFLDAGWPPDEGDTPFPEYNSPKMTALAIACSHKKPAIVKLLLDAGADPDLPGTNVPLVHACTSGSKRVLEMVEMLLAAGADPNPPAYQGKTLVEWIHNDRALSVVHAVLVAADAARKT